MNIDPSVSFNSLVNAALSTPTTSSSGRNLGDLVPAHTCQDMLEISRAGRAIQRAMKVEVKVRPRFRNLPNPRPNARGKMRELHQCLPNIENYLFASSDDTVFRSCSCELRIGSK